MRVGSEENMSDLVSQHVGQKCRGQPRPARPRDQQTVVHYGNNRNTVKWLAVGQGSWMRAFGYAGCERGVNREGVRRWAADLDPFGLPDKADAHSGEDAGHLAPGWIAHGIWNDGVPVQEDRDIRGPQRRHQ